MKIVNYISTIAVPVVIIIIVIYGIADKKKVYDIFVEGATEGMSIVIKIFPTLLGIFLAVGVLRSSGLLEIITRAVSVFTNKVESQNKSIDPPTRRKINPKASM